MTIDDESSWSMINDHGEELPDGTFQCLTMLDEFMFDDNLAHDPEKVILKIDPPSEQRSKPDLDIPLNPGWLNRYPYNGSL